MTKPAAESTPAEPLFIRVSDAKDRVGVSRATIYRWAKKGLPIYRRGGCSLIKTNELSEFIESGQVG